MDIAYGLMSSLTAALGLLTAGPAGVTSIPAVDMEEIRQRAQPAYIAEISDRQGNALGTMFRDGPLATPIEYLPPEFLEAVIAIEDRRFLEHRGMDPIGLAAALRSQFGPSPRGGSTIDQQMAKNAWLGPEVSLRRKIPEAILALRARQALGPRGVLQAYLETAWFGRGVTGAAGAAEAWFARPWSELTLGENAYLAGILMGPGFLDAERHPERALTRRNQVLRAMRDEGFITQDQAEATMQEDLTPAPQRQRAHGAQTRWMMSAALPGITREVDAGLPGDALLSEISVTLTLDPDWQSIAQEALSSAIGRISPLVAFGEITQSDMADLRAAAGSESALREIARAHLEDIIPWDSTARAGILIAENDGDWDLLTDSGRIRSAQVTAPAGLEMSPGQILAFSETDDGLRAEGRQQIDGSVVILDPRTGALLASVGGASPNLSAFDRTRARRQPGSSIKTFLWLAALDQGFHPDNAIEDFERDFITEDGSLWRPRNYGRSQAGMVSLRAAYEQSSNLAAAHLINRIGTDAMGRMAEGAGAYPDGMRRHMTAALGTMELSLLDLTRAHASIVNGGAQRVPVMIHEMTSPAGQVISNGMRVGENRMGAGPIAGRSSIEHILELMHGVTRRGTASQAFRDHPVTLAGKTGTTQGYRDAWFIGVTPHVAIGVWIGRDDNLPMPGQIAGGRHAAPVAARILVEAHAKGMIDAEGFTDEASVANISWPPAYRAITGQSSSPPQNLGWQDPQTHAQPPSGITRREVEVDPFWGVVRPAIPQGSVPQGNRDPRNLNRNEDLRRNRW